MRRSWRREKKMEILRILLVLVEVVTCFLLIGVILLQRSKHEGMGGLTMGAGMGEQLFGSRTGNVLTRTTVILGCIFMGATTLLAVLHARGTQAQSILEKKAGAAAPITSGSVPVRPNNASPVSPGPAAPTPVMPAAPVETPVAAPTVTIPPVATPPAPAPSK